MKFRRQLVAIVALTLHAFAGHADKIDQLVDVGNDAIGHYRLHIQCFGEGSPAVILDTGIGVPAYSWTPVLKEISKTSRVCIYDRAGYDESEKAPPDVPRTSHQIALELHSLLNKASVSAPYLMVGHSFGGFNIRNFENLFPSEVVGVILVDSSHEDQIARQAKYDKSQLSMAHREAWSQAFNKIPEDEREQATRKALYSKVFSATDIEVLERKNKKTADGSEREYALLAKSAEDLRALDQIKKVQFKRMPLTVISAGLGSYQDTPEILSKTLSSLKPRERELVLKDFAEFEKNHNELQTDLKRLSNNSKQVFADKSGHMIPLMQPEIIVSEILKMLEVIRKPRHPC